MHFITTHCCSNVLIDTMEYMTFFNTIDLTHWAHEGICCQLGNTNILYQVGVIVFFFGNSTGKIVKAVINGVKRGGVDVA